MKRLAVYCGAYPGTNPAIQAATVELADWLIANDYELVYGGGGFGLMQILAERVLAGGGRVHGIMPQNLFERGAALEGLTQLDVVPNMSIRKQQMLANADACLALPGGAGTLEEIVEAFSWARIGDNDRPCALLNVAGYYNPLAQMFDSMVTNGFLTSADRSKLLFSDSLKTIGAFFANYTPPAVRKYSK